ncbi:MAG: RdgB/HAM1 family non-canonical purine NTP pyrophosphatase [Nitrososphaerales archaeon]
MTKLYFASTNINKFNEVESILSTYNLQIDMAKLDLQEIQSEDLSKIAYEKAKDACKFLNSAVIVEDDGLFIDALNGFPGPYSAFVLKTICNKGILRLMEDKENRNAVFISMIAYCEPNKNPLTFIGEVKGSIASGERGEVWGYDPIFVPNAASGLTYAELGSKKNELSHRKLALEQFAKFYNKM